MSIVPIRRSCATRSSHPPALVACAGLLAVLTLPAFAGTAVVWDPAVEIDAPVPALSAGAGASVISSHGLFHLVYEKNDDIHLVSHDGSGWSAPVQISNDPAASRNPQLAVSFTPEILHVVWEDDRGGTSEVWARRWDGTTWTPEACLTCDAPSAGVRSAAPSIAASWSGAFVAWEEGTVGNTAIRGRAFDETSWLADEAVSDSPGNARMPGVVLVDFLYRVAWLDDRNGGSEAFVDERPWTTSRLVTGIGDDLVGLSHHAEGCCLDFVVFESRLALEHGTIEATSEVSVTDFGFELVDITGSERPNVGGFSYPFVGCGLLGGPLSAYATGRTYPATLPGTFTHEVAYWLTNDVGAPPQVYEVDQLSTDGLDRIVVGAHEGVPDATAFAVWIEERNGEPTIVASEGRTDGGFHGGVHDDPTVFVISPDGSLETTAFTTDLYGGDPVIGCEVSIWMDAALEADVFLDGGQDPPFYAESIGPDGQVTFAIRGGGCSEAGDADLFSGFEVAHTWPGVKSPDIDGDCVVDEQDRLYVEMRQGTTDYCADIDGSGFVDVDDYFIVANLVGTQCANITVGEGAATSLRDLVISPNPARGHVLLRVPEDIISGRAAIYDVAGRRVADLGPVTETGVVWDTRDETGASVAPGRYFARVTTGTAGVIVRAFSVIR